MGILTQAFLFNSQVPFLHLRLLRWKGCRIPLVPCARFLNYLFQFSSRLKCCDANAITQEVLLAIICKIYAANFGFCMFTSRELLILTRLLNFLVFLCSLHAHRISIVL